MPGGHTTQIACCLIACWAIASWLIACEEVWLIAVSAIEAIGSMRCEMKHLNHKNLCTYRTVHNCVPNNAKNFGEWANAAYVAIGTYVRMYVGA